MVVKDINIIDGWINMFKNYDRCINRIIDILIYIYFTRPVPF